MIHQITLTCWISRLLNLSLKCNMWWWQSLTCWVDEVSEYSQGAHSVSLIIVFQPLQDKHHQSVWECVGCVKERQSSKYHTRTRTYSVLCIIILYYDLQKQQRTEIFPCFKCAFKQNDSDGNNSSLKKTPNILYS